MKRTTRWALTYCFIVLSSAAQAVSGVETRPRIREAAAWMRDGTGDFTDQDPPRTWDVATGKNVLWKARLPNWSNGGPIAVKGRVYLMSEPFTGLPVLHCFDAENGAELWQREVDWTRQMPAAEGAAVRKQLAELFVWSAAMLREYATFSRLGVKTGKRLNPPTEPSEAVAAWTEAVERAKALGWDGRFGRRAGGALVLNMAADHPQVKQCHAFIRKYTPVFPAWGPGLGTYKYSRGFLGGSWEGMTFPTPVSDGERVWVLTGHAVIACYDREGQLVWMRRFDSRPDPRKLSPEQRELAQRPSDQMRAWPGSLPGGGDASSSPRLLDGKLVVQAFKFIRALDPATGTLLWEVPDVFPHGHNFGAPASLDVSGTPAVVTGRRGEVLSLSDGSILGGPLFSGGLWVRDGIVLGRRKTGAHRNVTRALRLTLAAEGSRPSGEDVTRSGDLWIEQLWEADPPVIAGGRPALSTDRLYGKGWIADLRTGDLVAGGKGRSKLPNAGGRNHSPMRLLVKDCELSIDALTGLFVFRDMTSHEVVGRVQMAKDPLGEANRSHVEERIGLSRWQWFGAGLPYVYEDRLYIRSHDFLYCVGRK